MTFDILKEYNKQLAGFNEEFGITLLLCDLSTFSIDQEGDYVALRDYHASLVEINRDQFLPLFDTIATQYKHFIASADGEAIHALSSDLEKIAARSEEPLAEVSDQIESFLDVLLNRFECDLTDEQSARDSLYDHKLDDDVVESILSLLGLAGAIDEALEDGEKHNSELVQEGYETLLTLTQDISKI